MNKNTAFSVATDRGAKEFLYSYYMLKDSQYQHRKEEIETEIARLKKELEIEEKQARDRAKPAVTKIIEEACQIVHDDLNEEIKHRKG